tara:strand:+ start:2991 stop:4343 length:1353 start_codon:yes stop_codon:yes gene_type:complete
MATPVIMPRQGQSVESCILTEWKVKQGDSVSEGDVLAVIETDKASFDLESTASGKVLELFWEADDDVPVLANVLVIGEDGENVEEFRPAGGGASVPDVSSSPDATVTEAPSSVVESSIPTTASAPISSNEVPLGGISAGVSPRARKLAFRHGLDPETLEGSGPNGRVIERDVEAVISGRPRLSASAVSKARDGMEPPIRGKGLAGMALASDMREPGAIEGAKVEQVKGIRKLVAERMIQSLQTSAQLTLNAHFELTKAQAYRKERVDGGKSKVSINDLIAYAQIQALGAHAELNAHFLGDRFAVFEKVHLGIAVDSPRGLMVPVVKDASDLSLEALSTEIKKLAIACREGTIQPDDLSGGSCTLTNLGMLGVSTFTPVLNVPEVAILGVGGIELKPKRTESGDIEYAEFLPLSLTIDHQAVDGAPAARFLQTLVTLLEENPGQQLSITNE